MNMMILYDNIVVVIIMVSFSDPTVTTKSFDGFFHHSGFPLSSHQLQPLLTLSHCRHFLLFNTPVTVLKELGQNLPTLSCPSSLPPANLWVRYNEALPRKFPTSCLSDFIISHHRTFLHRVSYAERWTIYRRKAAIPHQQWLKKGKSKGK